MLQGASAATSTSGPYTTIPGPKKFGVRISSPMVWADGHIRSTSSGSMVSS